MTGSEKDSIARQLLCDMESVGFSVANVTIHPC